MKTPAFVLFLLTASALPSVVAAPPSAVRVSELRTEYRVNPLGIDVVQPRLSWVLSSADPGARGISQSAYRVIAAGSEQDLRANKAGLWDSGKVNAPDSTLVVWGGKPLSSRMQIFWKVQVWDQAGKPAAWSEPASFSMGLLQPDDWQAKWIGREEDGSYKDPRSPLANLQTAHWIWSGQRDGTRFFRAKFSMPAGRRVVRALAVAGTQNNYEMFLNGKRLGAGGSKLPDVFYADYYLRPGENVIAAKATVRGAQPAGLIAAIRVEFDKGEPMLFASDEKWRAAGQAPDGWQAPGFDDSSWTAAADLGAYGVKPWGEMGYSEEHALAARMLRKEFDAKPAVKRATAYVSGLGLFELYVNGSKAGDAVLAPNLTDYDKHVFYVTYDVTRQIASGRNAAGLILGNGRFWSPRGGIPIGARHFGSPKARLQLELEYADGTKSTVVTDETWKLTTDGPVRANNEYDGEEYDARAELPRWANAGFDDSKWEAAQLSPAPGGALVAQMAEPLKVMETLHPVKLTEPAPGIYLFDMGQNMVGWCRLKLNAPKGTEITLRHAETLRDDGTLYLDNLRSARALDTYVAKGGGQETWEPRFTYHGFRFVEVRGLPGKPSLASLEGRVVHDSMATIVDFSSSNELLNKIHKNIFWGIRGNYRSIPTDCPQRDERQGWLGDRSQVSRSESYMFDVAAFYTKWTGDMADSQRPNGSIPDVSPNYWVIYNDDVTWPSTFLFVPGLLYDQYGDKRPIERYYPAMKKWVEHMRGFMKDGLMPKDTYGDWCVPPESPKLIHSQDPARRTNGGLIGTSYFYRLLKMMSQYARLAGQEADQAEYDQLAAQVKAAFQKQYFDAEKGVYGNGTQTSSILPLAFDMTPGENRKSVFDSLIRKIEQESKGHVGTGLVGAQWLMRTLSENGRADVAYEIATQKTYPGWGYMVEKGATTVWELWNGDTADPAMNSGNHVMQIGDLGIWMYEYLGGIRSDPQTPGFKHAIVRPYTVKDLSFVKASHKSMYGTLASRWRREQGGIRLDVTVPANTTATVYVPAKDEKSVTESGTAASAAKGVKFVKMEDGAAVFEVGSGAYSFRAAL